MKALSSRRIKQLLIIAACIALALGAYFFFAGRRDWKKIPDKKLKDVIYELHLVQGIANSSFTMRLPDSMAAGVYEDIFRRYKTTERDYDSTFIWMSVHEAEKLRVILESVIDSLNKSANYTDSLYKKSREGEMKQSILSSELESTNLLPNDSLRFHLIGRTLLNKYYTLLLSPGKNPRSRLVLTTRIWGLNTNNAKDTLALGLYVDTRENAESAKEELLITKDGLYEVSLPLPVTKKSGTITAFLRSKDSAEAESRLIVIDSLSLIRYDK